MKNKTLVSRAKRESDVRIEDNQTGLFFEHNPLPMWVYDLETYQFLAVNHAALKHYGYTEAEFKSMTIKDIRPMEDVSRLVENVEHVTEGLDEAGIWRHVKKDGSLIFVEVVSYTLEFAGRGAELVVVMDVTERKLAEQALRISEERYRSVVEDIDELICRFLPDGRLTYVNDSYCRYYGKSREELIGTSFIPSAAADFPQELRDHFNSFTPDRPTSRFEQYDLLPNGEKRWREWMDRAIFDNDGRLIEFQSTGRDITERKRAEELLRESEDRFRSYIEQASDNIFTLNSVGRIISANPMMCETLGYAESELLGMSALELVLPEKRMETAEALQRIWSGESVDEFEAFIRTRSGQTIIVQIRGRAFYKDGSLSETLHIARDITAQKRAEQALINSEERFRALIKNGRDNISLLAASGELLWESPAEVSTLGFAPDHFVGRNIFELMHPDDLSWTQAMFEQVIQTPGDNREGTFRLRHSDGSWRWIEATAANLLNEPHVQAVVINYRDVTGRKQAEAELHLRGTALESTANAIIITDVDGGIQWINPAYTRLTGYSVAEVLGRNPRILKSGMHDKEFYKTLWDTILSGQPWKGEMTNKRKDGSLYFEEQTITPLIDAYGKITHFIAIKQDITEQKRAQDALAGSEAELRAVFAAMQDVVLILDRNGVYQKIAPTNPGLLYKPPEELLGMSLAEIFPPQEADEFLTVVRKAMDSGQLQQIEYQLQIGDANHWFSASITPMSEDFVVWVARDITDRKQSEEKIRESEEKYRLLAENISDVIWILDVVTLRFRYVSPSVERLRGFEPEEVIAQELSAAITPESIRYLSGILPERLEKFNQGISESYVDEIEQPRRDGTSVWTETTTRFFTNGDTGALEIYGVSRDITERKQAEDALHASEERFRGLFNGIPVGLYRTTVEGRITDANPALVKMLGYPNLESLLAVNTKAIYRNAEDQKKWDELAMGSVGFIQNFETQLLRLDGTTLWATDSTRIIRNESGQTLCYEGSLNDITERKQAEEKIKLQLKRLSALKDIDHAIASSVDLKFNLSMLIDHVVTELNVDASAILTLNPKLNMLEYVAKKGFRGEESFKQRLLIGEDFAGRAARENRIIHIPDLSKTARHSMMTYLSEKQGFVSYWAIPLIAQEKINGVLEVFHRSSLDPDSDWNEFLATLAGQAAIAIETLELFEDLRRRNFELISSYDATIEGWSRAMDLRDKETEGHTQRVTEHTLKLATVLGMSENEIVHIRRGALLHDIGKMGVPDSILNKPDTLTGEEWVIMKRHPQLAYDMLHPIEYLRPALDIPYCHHEKWDGSGYPRGLKGEQIPRAARLFALVDVWDALRSVRPYREGWSKEKTLAYILGQSGRHFDPSFVEVFINIIKQDNGRNP